MNAKRFRTQAATSNPAAANQASPEGTPIRCNGITGGIFFTSKERQKGNSTRLLSRRKKWKWQKRRQHGRKRRLKRWQSTKSVSNAWRATSTKLRLTKFSKNKGSQRDLEIQAEEFQAKNNILEEQLAA